jgi:hypothetical protein
METNKQDHESITIDSIIDQNAKTETPRLLGGDWLGEY